MTERIVGLGRRVLPDGTIAEDAASFFQRIEREAGEAMEAQWREGVKTSMAQAAQGSEKVTRGVSREPVYTGIVDRNRQIAEAYYARNNNRPSGRGPFFNQGKQNHTYGYKSINMASIAYHGSMGGETPRNPLRVPRRKR